MKIINIPYSKFNSSSEGEHAAWIPLNKTRGVKVYHEEYNTLIELRNSKTLKKAAKEFKFHLQVLSKVDIVPEVYEVCIVKTNEEYRVGILMQNLGNVSLGDIFLPAHEEADILIEIEQELKENGIKHYDLHPGNVMFYKSKFWAIDFDPKFTTIKKVKKSGHKTIRS